ncbi:aminoacyl-tRNA hydrolase [Roseospira marina]|uniref:Peptidyl-tRNA hydrolase n=1 Tax=Roseospira marina TaxID=140057 RepID=A0A5M6I7V3_9PROT|nr:aminoacyl-tRNA hydrolase [Roseospira marina]KAA5604320.1 aminoacyl-tRNA hydrolase [Roseospira marina]MBB4315656.1 PTH1 family peptidyl-tRNA hydrolase [Roseospira marina]MBB5088714.1 PTH1 family peptidyl-tRNA hydrolase [Roseospira marina]
MLLLVGLGNPGAEYAGHRHNIGFMALDAIAARHGFGPFRSKFQGLLADGRLGGEKVLLLKPQTYMNLSGQAVGEAARFHKLEPADVIVFHDELDLAPGKVKVKTGGGAAGHNGLRSIDAHLGNAYRRVRLGIGHPGDKSRVHGWVLSNFAKADRDWLDPLMDAVAARADLLAEGRESDFMSKIAQDLRPPKPETPKTDKARANTAQARKAGPTDPAAATPEGPPLDAPSSDAPPADTSSEAGSADRRQSLGDALRRALGRPS